MQKSKKNMWNTRTVVFIALLVAMHIVLTRLIVIELGFCRITIGSICTILTGLWLGPLAGAVGGLVSDLLGCLIKGYVVDPFITLAAMFWGIIPGLIRPMLTGKKIRKIVVLCVAIIIASTVSSLILTTIGLVLFEGYQFMSIIPGRIIQWAVMTPIYCILTVCMYFSPITNLVLNATGVHTTTIKQM